MYFIIFVVILVVAVIVIYNTMLSKKNKLLKELIQDKFTKRIEI